MILIIHDLQEEEFKKLNISGENNVILSDNKKIKKCQGCFKCWTHTPKTCVIKDTFENNSDLFYQADKVIVFSKNYYGMFSPFVKNVFDRSISYVMPYFRKIYNETHHKKRYDKVLNMDYVIYGSITDNEKSTFYSLLKANQENFDSQYNVKFINDIKEYIYE